MFSAIGSATFYDIEEDLTACGTQHSKEDFVVATSERLWIPGGNPNLDPICQRWIWITNHATGKSITVNVQDKCGGCGENDLDLTEGAFKALGAELSQGKIAVEWNFT